MKEAAYPDQGVSWNNGLHVNFDPCRKYYGYFESYSGTVAACEAADANARAAMRSWYYYVTNAMYVKTAVITHERAFQALPADVREAVLKAAKDAEERGWEMCKKNEREGEKILASKGIVVGKASPAVMQALQKASEPLVQDWLKKAGPDGAALVKALR